MAEFEIRGVIHTAPVMFNVARSATQAELRDGRRDMRDALVAVVFSAAAVEALVGEIAELAVSWREQGRGGDTIRRFSEVMAELEESRASPQLKMRIAPQLLGHPSFDASSQPFSDYLLLLGLRNALVHLRPSRIAGRISVPEGQEGQPIALGPPDVQVRLPEVFRRLQTLGIIAPTKSWDVPLSAITEPRVSIWAVNAASAMAWWFLDLFPSDITDSEDVRGLRGEFGPIKERMAQ